MAGYLVRRVLWACVLFLVLTTFTFIVYFVIPGNRVQVRGQARQGTQPQVRDQLRLTGPVAAQYVQFLERVTTHGSLGRSYFNRLPVNSQVLKAASVTASVVIGGILIALLIAVPAGILSALRPRSKLDRAGMTVILLGVSVHPVVIALTLSFVFGARLRLLPSAGYCDVFRPSVSCGGPREWVAHLILPWVAFALPFAAIYTRMIRAYLIEALGEDHVLFARAKGASEARVIRAHALRPALAPLLTMLAVDAGTVFVGTTAAGTVAATLFVEKVFGLPGIGTLLVNAAMRLDLPILTGVTVFVTMLVLALMLVADLLTWMLDPRVRDGMPLRLRLPRLLRRRRRAQASQPAQTFS
ncbi:MAG TPA: ABC transporter permease [Gaiellaceae bacterium]